jgi:hypothetical protein
MISPCLPVLAHLASLIAGGPAPLIATALLASTGSGYSVAIYILVCAIVSISATIFLPDYTNQDISQEEAYRGPAPIIPADAFAGFTSGSQARPRPLSRADVRPSTLRG